MKHPFFILLTGLVLTTSCLREAEVALGDISGAYTVETGQNYTLFRPTMEPERTVGFMFYPGGLVASEGYFEMLTPIAEAGYPVVVVDMPLGLAAFSPRRGERVLERISNGPTTWAIGGHSLGGVMAARQVATDTELFDGLIMMAAWPAGNDDLSAWEGNVISIYGSEDALATPEEILGATELLPESTEYIELVGGNHAQFGSYGEQDEADVATITKEEQHELIQQAVIDLLEELE
ncbi:MAG TPA: alpha/beta hydrolase [Cytophagales bacterium]|nr:alpha/beta hydrolase [Cytophagales bacterium]HAP61494.1 alpha/beta hydrolase [Cytophagales bacterium]